MINVLTEIKIESHILRSVHLKRDVIIDIYYPTTLGESESFNLLLINDGQDLLKMPFEKILSELYTGNKIIPLLCVGIHCGVDRRNEYGVVGTPDFKGRGAKAGLYQQFIFEELFPLIKKQYAQYHFNTASFCGFSLGGLTALDIVWRNSKLFSTAGVFSGSLWWRSVSQGHDDFDEDKHRIMHQKIREGNFVPGLKFFFETGTLDEIADRNHNGIIDSIDDTLALIAELEHKGYTEKDIAYLELKDGHHDVETWARAFPVFLKWTFGKNGVEG